MWWLCLLAGIFTGVDGLLQLENWLEFGCV